MKFFAAFVLSLAIMISTALGSMAAIKVEKMRGRAELLASVMRDDPVETANLILQAYEMGALKPDPERVGSALAVIDRDLRAAIAAPPPYLNRTQGELTEQEAVALTAKLDHPDANERLAAAQVISGLHKDNPVATESMIEALENDASTPLSAAGMHTVITLLDQQAGPSWDDELRERCKVALETLAVERQLAAPTAVIAEKFRARLAARLTS
ncbi:MAG: hypothetical protein PVI23_00015 [Maricaulaceae bacterium]|jgi:hypothetical protein